MKKETVSSGRKHGLRARLATETRTRTQLTCTSQDQTYLWSFGKPRERVVLKH